MLTKRWSPTLLSKSLDGYALLEKRKDIYVNFGVHGPISISSLSILVLHVPRVWLEPKRVL